MNKIQKKILALTLFVLFIMASMWIGLTYYNQKTQNQYNEILNRYLVMNEVTRVSQQLITDLNNYLITSTKPNLEKLERSKAQINIAKDEMKDLRNAEIDFALTNYVNLIESLIETTDRSLSFKLENETEASFKEFTEATRISKYISEMTLTLFDTELRTYEKFYRGIIEQSIELKKLGLWLMLLMTFVLLFVTYWFSRSITRPVQQLTEAANELAKGRFDRKIEIESNDEISFLAKTFDRMRVNINNLISDIHEKAQLEYELQQNKLLLKESQLKSLQSQINPHFLYNTLNTLSKKAYLEGSEETSELLVSVAGLLRYNLKRIDRAVTLEEEVTVLKQYLDIQKARFTDRLQVFLEIDEHCMHVQLPGLTLQPIIENAVIHAVEPEEDGGKIWIRILDDSKRVTIEIEDEGPGMSEEQINQIFKRELDHLSGQDASELSTGIGFSNVVKRLHLFYGVEDVIDVQSRIGLGTKVVLKIPKHKEKTTS